MQKESIYRGGGRAGEILLNLITNVLRMQFFELKKRNWGYSKPLFRFTLGAWRYSTSDLFLYRIYYCVKIISTQAIKYTAGMYRYFNYTERCWPSLSFQKQNQLFYTDFSCLNLFRNNLKIDKELKRAYSVANISVNSELRLAIRMKYFFTF